MHPDDEIVLTMNEADFNLLREIWMDAYYAAKTKKKRERLRKFINRASHNSDTLTLSWLDRKFAEFP